MKKIILILICAYCLFSQQACQKHVIEKVPDVNANVSLLSIMQINFNFSIFLHGLQRTGLDSLFNGSRPYTIFLPDNVAFSHIGINAPSDLDRMSTDSLKQWMQYHILPSAIPFADLPRTINSVYHDVSGRIMYITNNDVYARVNGDTVISKDVRASDGYIHVLRNPLQLPWPSLKKFLQSDTGYTLFAAGLTKFGLLDQLDGVGPFTLLAPTNSAFAREGIDMDSINKIDPQHFKKYLYQVSILPDVRIFLSDLGDPLFAPAYGYDFNAEQFHISFVSPEGILLNDFAYPDYSWYSWEVLDPKRSSLNPDWTEYYSVFFGPHSHYDDQLNTYVNGPMIVDRDRFAANGVVLGLDDILIYPDSVRIH